MKKTIAFALIYLCVYSAFSQTLVNQTLHATFGKPNQQLEYIKAIPLYGNTVAFLDNSYSSTSIPDYESMHVVKYQQDSGFLAGMDLYFIHGRDFGTNLYSKGGKLYVTGFSTDSLFSHSLQCNLAVIDIATFDTIFTRVIQIDSAINQVPFAVAADDSGYIYLGAAVSTPLSFKMTVLRLSPAGTPLWQTDYDSVGYYSIPVAMALSGNSLAVTGFSFDNGGHSDFVTDYIDAYNGSEKGRAYAVNGAGMISYPVGIISDSEKHNYVAGTSTVAGTRSVIKVVKYDSLFNQLWTTTWGDSTRSTTASFMATDQPLGAGHIFVTGTTPNGNGGSDIVTLKYNPDGTLAWERLLPAADPTHFSNGVSIVCDSRGNVFVTGTTYNGSDTDIVTVGYDTAGHLLWTTIYNRQPGSNDVPYSMLLGDDGSKVIVYGRSNGSDSVYMAIQYEQLTKVNRMDTNSVGAHFLADQLIIRFDRSAVKEDAINNLDINFAKPDYWLKDSAYNALAAVLPFDISQCRFERIYKGLKTTYKRSLARNGDWVPIPDFWATFLLIHPDTKIDATVVQENINTVKPIVINTSLNYTAQLLCDPHPIASRISDPAFFGHQRNLIDDTFNCVPQYNISIDSAWRLETGKPFIKVGIYDSGLQGNNPEFSPTGDPYPYQRTRKVNGYDFNNHASLWGQWQASDNASNPHGTHVAGIIGAIRNNGLGIAGIAGGGYADTTDVGVSLYGMKVQSPMSSANEFTISLQTLLDAYVVGSSFVPDSSYGFGLHVTNHSYGLSVNNSAITTLPVYTDYHIQQMEEAFRYMYRNQVTAVVGAGNDQSRVVYPANLYGDYVVCVGGADNNGGRSVTQYNTAYPMSYSGPCVDVIAPSLSLTGTWEAYTTGWYTSTLLQGTTYNWFGTSMATPHGTGTAALLMSYLDSTASVYSNLSPEDIEHLITRGAVDVDTPGKDNNTGWGDLNAGHSLQAVNKSCKKLIHLGQDTSDNGLGLLVASNVPIKLLRPYNAANRFFDTLTYHFNVYKLSLTYFHSLSSNYIVEDGWTRPSSSTLLMAYDSAAHTLLPYEHLYMDSLGAQSIIMYGFVYGLLDTFGNPTNDFLGITDTNFNNPKLGFQYTLLVRDTTKSCYPQPAITAVKDVANSAFVNYYPNPTEDEGRLVIAITSASQTKIELTDAEGRILQTIYSGWLEAGTKPFEINARSLAAGVYFININLESERRSVKFVKAQR